MGFKDGEGPPMSSRRTLEFVGLGRLTKKLNDLGVMWTLGNGPNQPLKRNGGKEARGPWLWDSPTAVSAYYSVQRFTRPEDMIGWQVSSEMDGAYASLLLPSGLPSWELDSQ